MKYRLVMHGGNNGREWDAQRVDDRHAAVQQRRSQHRAAKNDRAASAGPKRYSSVSRARYVECRLARVGVCELAIMRERCLNAFTQRTFTSPGPWPLNGETRSPKGRIAPHFMIHRRSLVRTSLSQRARRPRSACTIDPAMRCLTSERARLPGLQSCLRHLAPPFAPTDLSMQPTCCAFTLMSFVSCVAAA